MKTDSDYMVHIAPNDNSHAKYLINVSLESIKQNSYNYFNQCIDYLKSQGSDAYNSTIVMFDGYGDTPEEIYEIMEVRNWVDGLLLAHPYFIYFTSRSMDTHINLLSCVGDITVRYAGEMTLSPNMYAQLGIDPLTQLPRKQWTLFINDILYKRMELSLHKLGVALNDPIGTNETIRMLAYFNQKPLV